MPGDDRHGGVSAPPHPDDAIIERMVRVRRALHRHPELSGEEHETQRLLAAELADAGIDGVRAIAGTGLVVEVRGERPGPLVVVRADMDALPVSERADVPFASEVPGVMHACGHDAHSAMGLGAACLASQRRDALPGTLRFVFQPAEEAEPLGGRRVVAEGGLADAVAAIALHVDPTLPTGAVGLREGPTMASSDEFEIVVAGRAGHAGWPQDAADAIVAAAAIVTELQTVVARRLDPRAPVTLHVGRIEGGSAANIVADRVAMHGTLRTLHAEARDEARRLLAQIAADVARASGAEASVRVTDGEPVLDNDPAVVRAFAAAAGADACRWLAQPTMNSEDFAFYTERLPAAMAWIGVRDEAAGSGAPLHHPAFVVDEAVLPIGARLLLDTAPALLTDPPPPR